MDAVAAERYRCAIAAVAPAAVVAPRAFVRLDCSTLEREVASYPVPCSW
jgi:hypothetical protein